MPETSYRGIDYSGILGARESVNRDPDTGIRYGVIPQNAVLQAWADESQPVYPDLECESCGALIPDGAEDCPQCDTPVDPFAYDYLEPIAHELDTDEYSATRDEYGDIFVIKSPYYTRAQFCSPCAPGACYLANPCADGAKAYCFGPDWFDLDPCPYPVFRVSDDSLVYLPTE